MSDETAIQALRHLADVMESTAGDLRRLAGRARTLADAITPERSWREVVGNEPRPLIVEQLTEIIEALSGHGAAFRRGEARALHAEGLSHERIAGLFGVTRQRIGALLADEPSGPAPRRRGRNAAAEER